MTHNSHIQNPSHLYSQGQLVIVDEIPSNFIAHESSVEVMLVPSGVRDVSEINLNWPRLELKSKESIPVIINSNFCMV